MTQKKSRLLAAIFATTLLVGVVGVGYAGLQIYQMRTSAGNLVLPAHSLTWSPISESSWQMIEP